MRPVLRHTLIRIVLARQRRGRGMAIRADIIRLGARRVILRCRNLTLRIHQVRWAISVLVMLRIWIGVGAGKRGITWMSHSGYNHRLLYVRMLCYYAANWVCQGQRWGIVVPKYFMLMAVFRGYIADHSSISFSTCQFGTVCLHLHVLMSLKKSPHRGGSLKSPCTGTCSNVHSSCSISA